MCSKKDYAAVAAVLRDSVPTEQTEARDSIARQLADHFAQDNPRFDRARFLKACGVNA